MTIDGSTFLATVRPALEKGNPRMLESVVSTRWNFLDLCQLLQNADVDVRRVAAVTLGFVGDMSCVPCLTRALHDTDEQVNQMADHGLWSIWFRRGGNVQAMQPFTQGTSRLAEENYQEAIKSFGEATRIDPHFAEAYNQCAIAHSFLGQWRESIDDCQRTLQNLPTHYGALNGMGHCHTQLGDLRQALDCYKRALGINPRMSLIRYACSRIESRLKNDSSGQFKAIHLPT
ncbi:MAG: tetratricopeptide repeat protein [Phycisphaeraceae bacterium]|nr:tetratricopeptide repeat protein [Phycisphaeraceae bacterium]